MGGLLRQRSLGGDSSEDAGMRAHKGLFRKRSAYQLAKKFWTIANITFGISLRE